MPSAKRARPASGLGTCSHCSHPSSTMNGSPNMSGNAVEIRGLEKAFPSFRLGPLDMTVPAGAIYGFVGPNGSGKTTTIDLIFGMGAKDAGSVTVLGLDHQRDEVAMKRQ